jgi:fluoride exporter
MTWNTLSLWLSIALAGALGTLARYLLGGWLARVTGGVIPWETFLINVSGSLAIGACAAALDRGSFSSPVVRMSTMVGFLGGFTTFSTFALETHRLAEDAQRTSALLYVLLTNIAALAAVWMGYRLTRLLMS